MLEDGLGDASLLFSQVEGFLNKAPFSTKKKKKKSILECVVLELILENILLLEVITLYHLDAFVLSLNQLGRIFCFCERLHLLPKTFSS